MNTILQKRIEEAAHQYIQSDAVASENMQLAFGDFINGANFALQNQWISVDEALPEDKTKVFVIVKTPVGIIHRADYHINDYWYMSRYSPEEIVTHWMPIPSLEGGVE
jgi:hypothetical protein